MIGTCRICPNSRIGTAILKHVSDMRSAARGGCGLKLKGMQLTHPYGQIAKRGH